MSGIQCLKCGNQTFTSVIKAPIGFPREVKFLRCAVCGGIVGVQEMHNQILKRDPDRIGHIRKHVDASTKTNVSPFPDINTILKRLYG